MLTDAHVFIKQTRVTATVSRPFGLPEKTAFDITLVKQ